MTDHPMEKKPRVSAGEAKELLIAAVIHLAETVPLPDLTARRIAAEANLDANAIFRHFESLEGLFIAAMRVIESRAVEHLTQNPGTGLKLIHDADLWIRFTSWLSLLGVPPAKLNSDPAIISSLQSVSLQRLGVPESLSDRAGTAMFTVALAFIQAQAILTPSQPGFFTPQVMGDAMALMAKMVEHVEQISNELGWEH